MRPITNQPSKYDRCHQFCHSLDKEIVIPFLLIDNKFSNTNYYLQNLTPCYDLYFKTDDKYG